MCACCSAVCLSPPNNELALRTSQTWQSLVIMQASLLSLLFQDFEADVINELVRKKIDIILMIGFMKIVSPAFVDRFAWRILNVHPSLLPAFAGGMDANVHAAVLAAGVPTTGCTVHFVSAQVDGGAILVQKACAVAKDETVDSLKAKVQALEGEVRLYTSLPLVVILPVAAHDDVQLAYSVLRPPYHQYQCPHDC